MFSSPSFFPSFPTHKVSQNLQPNSFKTLDILIASAFAIIFASQLDSVIVVYNFFAESHQAKQHRRNVTFHAVGKSRMWGTAGGLPG